MASSKAPTGFSLIQSNSQKFASICAIKWVENWIGPQLEEAIFICSPDSNKHRKKPLANPFVPRQRSCAKAL